MNHLPIIAALLLSGSAVGAFQNDPALLDPERWHQAEREIRRLSPEDFPDLPKPVVEYLRQNGYAIPQCCDSDKPHNVIQGYFDADKTLDIAVLGSRGGFSEILVFWSSSAVRVARIERASDDGYLQIEGDDQIVYSRAISVVGREFILDHYRAYGGPEPPPIRHDAINDAFVHKGSSALYFDGKQWHTLTGAD